jgi:hypothetical protein
MPLITGSSAPRFSQYTADQFVGTGSQTTFTLTKTPPASTSVIVTINGVKQHSNTYTLTGNQIIFSEAPYNGDAIECTHLATQGVSLAFDNASVTSDKLAPGSVIASKLDIASQTGTGAMLQPAGTTAQRPVSPQVGWERFNTTLTCKEVWDGTQWTNLYDGIISQWAYGTGGTITTSGSWRIHTFTTTADIVFSQAGRIQLLIVAGGGGGGADVPGGGGAGGIVYSDKFPIAAGTYTCTVGAGGSASTQPARNGIGANSSIIGGAVSLVAFGGGGGGGWAYVNPSEGGSGGGADGQDTYRTRSGARALQQRDLYKYTTGYGNRGGNGGGSIDGYAAGGGGGGAGMPGGNGDACTTSSLSTSWQGRAWEAAGGDGLPFDISGSTVWYGGGGGGSSNNATSAGYGGRGGGGNADAISGSYNSGNINGVANTGGGGGARGNGTLGGNGGSGIVIIRYLV